MGDIPGYIVELVKGILFFAPKAKGAILDVHAKFEEDTVYGDGVFEGFSGQMRRNRTP